MSVVSQLVKPILEGGKYNNPFKTWYKPGFSDVLKWQWNRVKIALPSQAEIEQRIPVFPVDSDKLNDPPKGGISYTWIGHATFFVQMGGVNIITDPVFGDRCSPISFIGPKRLRPVPCKIRELPNIDLCVISHNHYDHLDFESVREIEKFHKETHWFVPQGLKEWFTSAGTGVNPDRITELSWWDQTTKEVGPEKKLVDVVCTPTQHWSKRGAFDDMKALWCSWVIKTQNRPDEASSSSNINGSLQTEKKFYFTGDTGYCEGFKQIGDHLGPFDLAAIPIGAYEPRAFMKYAHVNPEEAVKIHQDLKSQKSVAMHWGTFVLTDEHFLEPPIKLKEEREKVGLNENDFQVADIGKTYSI